MHPYATDSSERKYVPLYIAILSTLLAWGFSIIVSKMQIIFPWWLSTPSVLGGYGIFYSVFSKYLWRISIFRKIGLIKIPDLNGTWEGQISSSFDDHKVRHNAIIKICQTWREISIVLDGENSKSHSLIASIITKDPNAITISYEYLNEPRSNAKTTMEIHRGTTKIVTSNGQTFSGQYYSGRGRQNFGMLHDFTRKER